MFFFFFNDTATTEIYTSLHTLSLHDALPISPGRPAPAGRRRRHPRGRARPRLPAARPDQRRGAQPPAGPAEPPRPLRPRAPRHAPLARAPALRVLGARR